MRKKVYILLSLLIMLGLILVPLQCIEGAKEGIELCMKVIIPSLFPFFVCCRLLSAFGFVEALGRRSGGIMRPLFNVPGGGAFAFCMGILSGYPVGAKTAVTLYEQGLCTKTETERLLAFCNNSGPLFIIGSVGTILYQSPQIGFLLYIAHILSAVSVGIIFRFYKFKDGKTAQSSKPTSSIRTVNMGAALSDAINDSIISMAMVCGYIMLFSVAIKILIECGIISFFAWLITLCGIDPTQSSGLAMGIFELTNGIKILSASGGFLPSTAFLLAWSGISVIMQVAGIISKHKLSITAFIAAKLIQGGFAAFYTFLLSGFASRPALAYVATSSSNITVDNIFMTTLGNLLVSILLYLFFTYISYLFSSQKK